MSSKDKIISIVTKPGGAIIGLSESGNLYELVCSGRREYWVSMGIDSPYKREEKPKGTLLQYKPTENDLINAALGYIHNFGLLPSKDQEHLKAQAKNWLIAWGHTLPDFKREI